MGLAEVWNRAAARAIARPAVWIGNTALLFWLGYLLIGPTIGFGWIDSWHNEQRAIQVILLVGTAVAFSALVATGAYRPRASRGPTLLTVLFLALGVVSALRSGDSMAGLAEVSLIVLLITLAATAAQVTASVPSEIASWTRHFALLFCAAYALGVAVRLFAAFELGRSVDRDVLLLGYANPRFASAFHVALLPLIAAIALDSSTAKWLRVIAVLTLTATWGINWGLGTRGVWFAYLLALPALAMLVGWHRVKAQTILLLLTALMGVFCFELLVHVSSQATSVGTATVRPINNATLTSREVLWNLSWQAVKESPLLGIGPMNFAALGSVVGAHPHNWILQASAEWGVPATLILGICVFLALARMRRQTTPFGIAVSCSILASAALGLVDGNLVMPITQSAFALTVGVSVGYSRHRDDTECCSVGTPLAAAALAASLCLATYALSSFATQDSAREAFQRAHPSAWPLPRFWEHGLL